MAVWVIVASSAACRDASTTRGADPRGLVRAAQTLDLRPRAAPLQVSAAPCPWAWSDDDALALEAPTDAPFEFAAACSGAQLSVVWRVASAAAVASRALRPEAKWQAPRALADDAASLGRPLGAATAVWVAWTTPSGSLRSARVDGGVMRAADVLPAEHARFRDAVVLHARGDQALVAATYTARRVDRVIAHRVGVGSAPPAGAVVGDGQVVAAAAGERPVLVGLVKVDGARGGPWHLRAWRFDAPVAMALTAPATAGAFGVLPDGGAAASALLPVGIGRFEFARALAPGSAALLFQTVLGAERGAPRVAWFPPRGAPEALLLPVAMTGVGAALDAGGESNARRVAITYWGDRNALERAAVTPSNLGAPARVGAALASEFAVYEAARSTQWVTCDGAPWRVEARRDGGTVRVLARREACYSPLR